MNDRDSPPMDPKPDAEGQQCACPADSRIAQYFDAKAAERLAKGQEHALVAVSQRLLDALLPLNPTGRTVLELGCGRGGLLLRLVQEGATRATGVDISAGSIDVARNLLDGAQLAERVSLSIGDAARVPLEPHDWVILDRVICCYPDVERLLANTEPAARALYAFTVPTSRGWRGVISRIGFWLENIWNTIRGLPCPGYVHDLDLIEEHLRAAGFRLRHQDPGFWHVAIYERVAA